MKNLSFIFLTAAILLTASCKKDENGSGCTKPEFNVSGGTNTGTSASISISTGVYGFLEIEYGSNGFARGSGIMQTISGSYYGLTGLSIGTYDVYVRGNCGGSDWSDWSGPKSFLVQQGAPSCATPTDLEASSGLWLTWEHSPYGGAEKYELEYGVTGFSLGSGTRVTVPDYYGTYSDGIFAKGTTYDFYVRADCGSNDWSTWAGPHTFSATENRNMCLPPVQVNVYSVYNFFGDCVGGRFDWDANGESDWEVSLVSSGGSPGSGNITSIQSTGIQYNIACWGYYDFYIRAVCQNGNKTAWKGPTEF